MSGFSSGGWYKSITNAMRSEPELLTTHSGFFARSIPFNDRPTFGSQRRLSSGEADTEPVRRHIDFVRTNGLYSLRRNTLNIERAMALSSPFMSSHCSEQPRGKRLVCPTP